MNISRISVLKVLLIALKIYVNIDHPIFGLNFYFGQKKKKFRIYTYFSFLEGEKKNPSISREWSRLFYAIFLFINVQLNLDKKKLWSLSARSYWTRDMDLNFYSIAFWLLSTFTSGHDIYLFIFLSLKDDTEILTRSLKLAYICLWF